MGRFIMTWGLIGSKITNKLIVAQMTKSELPYLDCVFLGPVLMYVNQSKGPFISERILLNVILVFAIVDYALYCQKVCQDICEQTGWRYLKSNRTIRRRMDKGNISIKFGIRMVCNMQLISISNTLDILPFGYLIFSCVVIYRDCYRYK